MDAFHIEKNRKNKSELSDSENWDLVDFRLSDKTQNKLLVVLTILTKSSVFYAVTFKSLIQLCDNQQCDLP